MFVATLRLVLSFINQPYFTVGTFSADGGVSLVKSCEKKAVLLEALAVECRVKGDA